MINSAQINKLQIYIFVDAEISPADNETPVDALRYLENELIRYGDEGMIFTAESDLLSLARSTLWFDVAASLNDIN